MNIEHDLASKIKDGLRKNKPMARYTSWKVGGPADYFVSPADLEELILVIQQCDQHNLPLYILGNGTNLLVLDGGIRGMVVQIGSAFSYVNTYAGELEAGAGTPMFQLSKNAAEAGLRGLEFAVGIPGSLGGALIMNAGAFGGYIGELVESVKLVDFNAEVKTVNRDQLSFSYRSSNLIGTGVIVEARLKMDHGDPAELLQTMQYYSEERRRRHPNLPSAGSVFRNLPDKPAGRIIDEAGAKGMRIGGAEVSKEHANFIVNTGGATAADILSLIEKVRKLVKEKFGLELRPEIRIIGEES
ncbi:MAG: UDP-N-acetylmuramate dehydrogenase [Bacillota bacterium]